jgi:signal transduction histidine kinase
VCSSDLLSCSAAPIRLSGKGPLGAVVTFTDITTLRELEEQRENLLRAVSHDIRNPLTAILLNAQMLERSTVRNGAETDRRNANVIVTAVQRLDGMIQELVDSSRLHDGQMKSKKRALDLRSLISDLLPRVSGTIDPARVAADLPTAPLPVEADPAQLERVIVNLLGNSSKYAAEGTRVRLRLEAREREAIVSLKDEGPGISPKDLPHIFDRFYRAGNAEEKEGLGLGLYISKKLIENHGGKMWAESEPGQGSTFFFTLPLSGST